MAFSDRGMEGSGMGARLDTMAMFARFWGWSYNDYMNLPIRVRHKMVEVLRWQLKEIPPTTL